MAGTKYKRICRVLAVAIILSLMVVAIPASPVLAAESIALVPATGEIGDEIRISGDSFSTAGTQVYIYLSSQEGTVYNRIDDDIAVYKLVAKTTANADGQMRTYFEVPALLDEGVDGRFGGSQEIVGGSYYVYVAYGDSDKIEAVAGFTVRGIALNPTSGLSGDMVEVAGVGFGEESGVSIIFAGNTVATDETDAYGSFSARFTVPDVAAAAYDVTVEDADGNDAQAEFTVSVAPDITIIPVTTEASPGYVGMNVTIRGIGFKANSSITVTYAAEPVAVTTSNVYGVFATAFDVPQSVSGEYPITVSDGTDTLPASFVMESQAPPAPVLLSPQDSAEIEALRYFDWADVADDSLPLTYALQVASGENFVPSAILLEKTGLSGSEYAVAQGERLPPEETPYYWRVRATDGAANEGEWSTAGPFYLSQPAKPLLPEQPERLGWLIYLWIGLAVAVVILAGYLLRKGITRSRRAR